MVSNGMPFSYLGAVSGMPTIVQDTVMDIQIGLEDGFERLLRARGKPGVLLCDRGLMDGAAYMTEEEWDKLIKKRDVDSVSELREGRYNAVYHMVTAAEGAEPFYTLENNAVRTESAEEARALDHQTRKAWVGHPNLKIFDNSTSFEKKLQRVVEEMSRLVGLPHCLERVTTKFLLRGEPDLDEFPEDVAYQIFEVEKVRCALCFCVHVHAVFCSMLPLLPIDLHMHRNVRSKNGVSLHSSTITIGLRSSRRTSKASKRHSRIQLHTETFHD
jgi:hypothetical protein